MQEKDKTLKVYCPYCNNEAILTTSLEVYKKDYGMIWLCKPCNAYVGTHKGSKTHKPYGRLSNKELRTLKKQTHAVFDPLWRRKQEKEQCAKSKARKMAYKWLAKEMSLSLRECHIGMFDENQCSKAILICRPICEKLKK